MDNTISNIPIDREKRRAIVYGKDLSLPEIPFVGRYDYPRAFNPLKPHLHPDAFEFCYLARGRQSYTVAGREFRLRGGDCFVTFPDETHGTGSHPEEKGLLYWATFEVRATKKSLLGLNAAESGNLVKTLHAIRHRHFRGTSSLRALLDSLFTIAENRASPLRRQHFANRFTAFLWEVSELARKAAERPGPNRFDRIARVINERITEPLPVPELAKRSGLSVPRFKFLFKQTLGMPPAEYVLRTKIEKAASLLKAKGSSVTSVAFGLGFSSSQYFATAFKRYTGKQPRDYLNQK